MAGFRRYRLFVALLAVSVVAGLGVALAPLQRLADYNSCMNAWQTTRGVCGFKPDPDLMGGFWVAVVVYALLTGLVLSARALSAK